MSLCDGILGAPCLVVSTLLHEIGYWFSWRFVQQMHSRTIESMRRMANGVDANWILEEEWLDVYTVRRTAETLIDPFVWKWSSRGPPPEIWGGQANWGWIGMWLSQEERAKVLTDTLAGFLAASPEEIQDAAQQMNQKSEADGSSVA